MVTKALILEPGRRLRWLCAHISFERPRHRDVGFRPRASVLSSTLSDRDEIKRQLHDGFEGTDYPVTDVMDLAQHCPTVL